MNPETLKETTMNPKPHSLMKVQVLDHKATGDTFDRLMGKDPAVQVHPGAGGVRGVGYIEGKVPGR